MTARRSPWSTRGLLARLIWVLPLLALIDLAVRLFVQRSPFENPLAATRERFLWLALGLAILPWCTNAARIFVWARVLGAAVTKRRAFSVALAIDVGGAISPTLVGGLPLKAAALLEAGVSPAGTGMLCTIAAVEDALFILVAIPFCWFHARLDWPALSQDRAAGIVPFFIGGVISLLLLRVALRRRRAGGKLTNRLRRAIVALRRAARCARRSARSVLPLTLGLTAVQWTARYSVATAILAALGLAPDPIDAFLRQWIAFVMMSLSPAPGGAGVAEPSLSLAFAGVASPEVLSRATAIWRFVLFYLVVGLAAVGLLGLGARPTRGEPRNEAPPKSASERKRPRRKPPGPFDLHR